MKIAVLLSRFPYPLEKGDKLRAFHQIKELAKNNEIILLALSDKAIPKEHVDIVKQYCTQIYCFRLRKCSIVLNICKAFMQKKQLQVGYF